MSGQDDQGAYQPSPSQIRAGTLDIQADWDAKTWRKRLVTDDTPEPWTVPEVCTTNTARYGVTRKLNANVDART